MGKFQLIANPARLNTAHWETGWTVIIRRRPLTFRRRVPNSPRASDACGQSALRKPRDRMFIRREPVFEDALQSRTADADGASGYF